MQLKLFHYTALTRPCISEYTTVKAITIPHLNNYIVYKNPYVALDILRSANQLMLEVMKQCDGN